jgi:hypothetical protein
MITDTTHPQSHSHVLRRSITASTWLAWLLMHMLIWALAGAWIFGLDSSFDTLRQALTLGAVLGLLLGLGQWLILRRHLARLHGWPLLSVAGLTGGIALGYGVGSALQALDGIATLASVATGALFLGLLQWLLLRRHLRAAIWWLPATLLAWGLGLPAGWILVILGFILEPTLSLPGGLLTGLLTGLIGGAISGVALIWLLRRNA